MYREYLYMNLYKMFGLFHIFFSLGFLDLSSVSMYRVISMYFATNITQNQYYYYFFLKKKKVIIILFLQRQTQTYEHAQIEHAILLRIIFGRRSIVYSSCSGGYYIWYFFITATAATDSITITRRHIASVNHYTEKDNEKNKENSNQNR